MSEKKKAWDEFVLGNIELFANHYNIIGLAFDAGFLAGKQVAKK